MPVPLSTAALVFAAILAAIGIAEHESAVEAVAIGMAALGVLNQFLATWATSSAPPPQDVL